MLSVVAPEGAEVYKESMCMSIAVAVTVAVAVAVACVFACVFATTCRQCKCSLSFLLNQSQTIKFIKRCSTTTAVSTMLTFSKIVRFITNNFWTVCNELNQVNWTVKFCLIFKLAWLFKGVYFCTIFKKPMKIKLDRHTVNFCSKYKKHAYQGQESIKKVSPK